MRRITSHFLNSFNRDHVEVSALDGAGPGGASHHYRIDVFRGSKNSDGPDGQHATESAASPVEITFQKGPVQEVGVNGVTDEALLAVILDRIQGFQRGPFGCRENAIVVTKLQEAMHWLRHRAEDREVRGVEGTSQK